MLRLSYLLLLLAGNPAVAEEIGIPLGQQGSSNIDVPARGEHKHDVLERFGLADQEHPAVGRPPILRWDYREFSVYFENDRVINSVLHHQPTHPAQEQSLP
ncbi:phosphodiesterase [Stutzerimonas degradans]|nr:phosphodiesterase [Stutzerimonas degradans]